MNIKSPEVNVLIITSLCIIEIIVVLGAVILLYQKITVPESFILISGTIPAGLIGFLNHTQSTTNTEIRDSGPTNLTTPVETTVPDPVMTNGSSGSSGSSGSDVP